MYVCKVRGEREGEREKGPVRNQWVWIILWHAQGRGAEGGAELRLGTSPVQAHLCSIRGARSSQLHSHSGKSTHCASLLTVSSASSKENMGRQKLYLEKLSRFFQIRNLLLRQALAECLGTLILVVSLYFFKYVCMSDITSCHVEVNSVPSHFECFPFSKYPHYSMFPFSFDVAIWSMTLYMTAIVFYQEWWMIATETGCYLKPCTDFKV